jgi:hypothetical protein
VHGMWRWTGSVTTQQGNKANPNISQGFRKKNTIWFS